MDRIEKRQPPDGRLHPAGNGKARRCFLDFAGPGVALRHRHCERAAHKMPDLENWMWKEKKIRIRGGVPTKIRLSTPYYLLPKDVDRYLAAYDEYRAPISRPDDCAKKSGVTAKIPLS